MALRARQNECLFEQRGDLLGLDRTYNAALGHTEGGDPPGEGARIKAAARSFGLPLCLAAQISGFRFRNSHMQGVTPTQANNPGVKLALFCRLLFALFR